MNTTPVLTAKRLAGIASAAKKFNAAASAAHAAKEAVKPADQRTAYVAVSDESFAREACGKLFDRYFDADVTERMELPENREVYRAIIANSDDPAIAAIIEQAKAAAS